MSNIDYTNPKIQQYIAYCRSGQPQREQREKIAQAIANDKPAHGASQKEWDRYWHRIYYLTHRKEIQEKNKQYQHRKHVKHDSS